MFFLHRNLVSIILLNKAGLKTIIGDDKVIVISCNGVFVSKEYLNGSLFVLNLASETMNEMLLLLLTLLTLLIYGMVG